MLHCMGSQVHRHHRGTPAGRSCLISGATIQRVWAARPHEIETVRQERYVLSLGDDQEMPYL